MMPYRIALKTRDMQDGSQTMTETLTSLSGKPANDEPVRTGSTASPPRATRMLERLKRLFRNPWFWLALVAAAVAAGWHLTQRLAEEGLPSGIPWGNGRVEAVAIDIATRTGGRIREILVHEGETVSTGQFSVIPTRATSFLA